MLSLLCSASVAAQQSQAPARQALLDELHNVQALPYGYTAASEAGDLKLRRAHGATFVVRTSRLCLGWRGDREPGQGDSFTLCSTDPAQHNQSARVPVGKCAQLQERAFMPSTVL